MNLITTKSLHGSLATLVMMGASALSFADSRINGADIENTVNPVEFLAPASNSVTLNDQEAETSSDNASSVYGGWRIDHQQSADMDMSMVSYLSAGEHSQPLDGYVVSAVCINMFDTIKLQIRAPQTWESSSYSVTAYGDGRLSTYEAKSGKNILGFTEAVSLLSLMNNGVSINLEIHDEGGAQETVSLVVNSEGFSEALNVACGAHAGYQQVVDDSTVHAELF